jgi:hypothetical protein
MTYVAKEMEDADITCNNKLHPVCETAFPGQEAEWCHPCRLRISIARTTYFSGFIEEVKRLREFPQLPSGVGGQYASIEDENLALRRELHSERARRAEFSAAATDLGTKVEKLRNTLTRHAQLARTLSRTENLYTPEHLERRLAEADITLEATKP